MEKLIVLAQKKNRLTTLEANGKNVNSSVCKKLRREIRNIENGENDR